MFAYIGSSRRAKKTLAAAVRDLADGYTGEKAIFDTETGDMYSWSGEPTILLTPESYRTVKHLLGICALTASAAIPFPSKTVASMLSTLAPSLARDAANSAAEIYKNLRKQHGSSKPPGTVETG